MSDAERPRRKHNDEDVWLCLRFAFLSLNAAGASLNAAGASLNAAGASLNAAGASLNAAGASLNAAGASPNTAGASLDAAGAFVSGSGTQAVAITEQQRIYQCNTSAIKSGVQPGLSINHALMLNPQVELLERDPEQEARKLQELAYWAYRFTSIVSVYNDTTLLLEVGRSIKLFNGLNHLLHLITNDLKGFRMDAKLAIAHTPKAAYALSFESDERVSAAALNALVERQASGNSLAVQTQNQLARLPVSCLDIAQKTIDQLNNCGFELLADINEIPGAELGRRFGAGLLAYLDQLWGEVADPQIATTPPETFESSTDFAEPIRNLQWIRQQIDRLLADLTQFIKQRQLVCRSFTWRFYHENNRLLHTVTVGLSAKQNDLAMFRQLTELKLATIKLDWEFSSIQLSSNQLIPIQLFHDDLFDPLPSEQQFNQLIDKLTNRLGHNTLFRVCQVAEHLPELANDRLPAVQESVAAYTAQEYDSEEVLKDQPLWLLENPQRLAQQQRQPLYEGPLCIIHGPDRICSDWWNKIQSRDYFIARQRSGRLLWIFFDRKQQHWFLHGLFA